LVPIPSLISGYDNNKEIMIAEYEGNFTITCNRRNFTRSCMDEKRSFMELWVLESYNRRE
jgi:hypothetical protein